MVAARQLRRLRQQVVKMATPPGGVFALAEALGLGRVQNLLNPAATREAVSAFVDQIGFSTASTSSVAMVSTGLARNAAA